MAVRISSSGDARISSQWRTVLGQLNTWTWSMEDKASWPVWRPPGQRFGGSSETTSSPSDRTLSLPPQTEIFPDVIEKPCYIGLAAEFDKEKTNEFRDCRR